MVLPIFAEDPAPATFRLTNSCRRSTVRSSSFYNYPKQLTFIGGTAMSKVQWRPQLNALTTPQSYKAQPVPKDSLGYDEIAERIALKNPVINAGLAKSALELEREVIKEELINGNQVSLENFV
ncbi:MAG: hypothetical protein D3904_03995, partial [Candidatus Electrothrix sp. EH2]|nr:hypothetical protein [Candidatus Electrothrix sp. EH2]